MLLPRGGFDLGEDPSVIRLERALEALAHGIGQGLLRHELLLVAGGASNSQPPWLKATAGIRMWMGGQRTAGALPGMQDRNDPGSPPRCFLLEQISLTDSPTTAKNKVYNS